ncbi:hypothetical protein ABH924_002960 [Arthrobacter sp. GAS37]
MSVPGSSSLDVGFCSIIRMDKFRARGITGPATLAKRMIQQNPTVSMANPGVPSEYGSRLAKRRCFYPSPMALPKTLKPTNATMSRRAWATTSGMTRLVFV